MGDDMWKVTQDPYTRMNLIDINYGRYVRGLKASDLGLKDARLIAAAPDLLAACEQALPELQLYKSSLKDLGIEMDGPTTFLLAINNIKNALEKAKGG